MNRWLLLLVLGGLGTAGYFNRELIMQKLANRGIDMPASLATATPAPQPIEARASQLRAMKAYPALANESSLFHKRYIARYTELKQTDPAFLTQSDWPVRLAEQVARDLGGAPMPIPPDRPPPPRNVPMKGTALDQRPIGHAGPPPKGTMLDQLPKSSK